MKTHYETAFYPLDVALKQKFQWIITEIYYFNSSDTYYTPILSTTLNNEVITSQPANNKERE